MQRILAAALVLMLGSVAGASEQQQTLPIHTVRIQVVQLADDDGGRRATVSPEAVRGSVDIANKIYAPVGLRLEFDPRTDCAMVKNTAANSINVDPKSPRVSGRIGSQVAARYPGKLVVLFRYGSDQKPTGSGFAHWRDNFVAMGGVYKESGPRFAHELGHYLGLLHTHRPGFDTVQEAEAFFKRTGRNPAVFDGDGLSDTPPDPLIRPLRRKPTATSVELDGVTFELPRRNLMSYYNEGDSLTPQQIAMARWLLEYRLKNNMRFPVNTDAGSPIRAETLRWSGTKDCDVSKGKIPTRDYDALYWSSDSWLFFRFGEKGNVELVLPVAESGRFRLDFYAARSPDFGKFQFSLDGKPLGEPIDAYAPRTMPSGRISLGTMKLEAGDHRLRFDVVGKNEASTGYNFALDCIELGRQ